MVHEFKNIKVDHYQKNVYQLPTEFVQSYNKSHKTGLLEGQS